MSASRTCWGYSVDAAAIDWYGRCSSKEEAIAEAPAALDLHPGDVFFVATGDDLDPEEFVPDLQLVVDHIVEGMNGVAHVPGQSLVVDPGAGEALDTALRAWAHRFIGPTKWVIREVEKCVFSPAPSEANGKSAEVAAKEVP